MVIKRLLQQENAYFDTGALYQNKRFLASKSPSLRGSGLKLQIFRRCCCSSRVSLFTREWIEINSCRLERHKRKWVSLFTREWIEITQILPAQINLGVSLFTREWIEMLKIQFPSLQMILSPSLRGSGLKSLIIC